MKQIDNRAANALVNGNVGRVSSNTEVVLASSMEGESTYELQVFGNGIAAYDTETDTLYMRNCGYETKTTKNRLNAVWQAVTDSREQPIRQRNHEWRWNDKDAYDVIGKNSYKSIEVDIECRSE